jgi:hypothetical protein
LGDIFFSAERIVLAKLALVGEWDMELFLLALFSAPEATFTFAEIGFPDFGPV